MIAEKIHPIARGSDCINGYPSLRLRYSIPDVAGLLETAPGKFESATKVKIIPLPLIPPEPPKKSKENPPDTTDAVVGTRWGKRFEFKVVSFDQDGSIVSPSGDLRLKLESFRSASRANGIKFTICDQSGGTKLQESKPSEILLTLIDRTPKAGDAAEVLRMGEKFQKELTGAAAGCAVHFLYNIPPILQTFLSPAPPPVTEGKYLAWEKMLKALKDSENAKGYEPQAQLGPAIEFVKTMGNLIEIARNELKKDFISAIKRGDLEEVEKLSDYIRRFGLKRKKDAGGHSFFVKAVISPQFDVAELLLKESFYDHRDNKDRAALYLLHDNLLSAKRQPSEVLRKLLEAPVKPADFQD